VLVKQLPPGARLWRAHGGPAAFSDAVTSIHYEGYRIMTGIMQALGVKKRKLPDPITAPEPGWREAAEARAERSRRKAANWLARQKTTQ
jgi:hypothetical protein